MIARKYETIVGVFVVASLVALLVMVLIIAKQEGLFQEYVEYRAVFKNVSNLKPNSEVHLAGVMVGNVDRITINPGGTITVTFRVMKQYSSQIRWDTEASIGFMGLLGDKSLDLTAGSPEKPPVPPEGFVTAVEPLDITQLLAKAGPSLEDLQKILHNIATLTGGMGAKKGDLTQILKEAKEILTKINEGQGTLGLLVNNPALYKEATKTMTGADKFISGLDQGIFGTGKKQALGGKGTLADFHETLANANQTVNNLKEASRGLPGMMKKIDGFLNNLDKAGKGLPGLVTSGEALFSDADQTAKAANKSWLLRWYVPKPQERTLRLDGEPGKDKP
jgi:phospholipid/cholesterol/gamma-HCH transport system substrate-binding protein